MKSTDWAIVILVAAMSFVGSMVIGSNFVSTEEDKSARIEKVIMIDEKFNTPDPETFNEQAINLTQIVEISESDTPQPFSD